MRPVDSAIRCPVCDYRSKSKVEAFEHERPHLEDLLRDEDLLLDRTSASPPTERVTTPDGSSS